MRAFVHTSLRLAAAVGLILGHAAKSGAAEATTTEEKAVLEEIVVTGVFYGVEKQNSAVAISTLDLNQPQFSAQVPVSAFDLLKNVPGVFVNSARGDVFVELSARGLQFISVNEDGLPISKGAAFNPVTLTYFLRSDATLERIEAVRGGSAAVTGASAPAGIFNYITRSGGDTFSGKVLATYGLQGDGELPQYRTDFAVGGPLTDDWSYFVGGFYREDDGQRDAGYQLNRGGQLKANLTRDFDRGFVQIYGKYLDDHNAFVDSVPAVDFSSPRGAPGWSNTSSALIPSVRFRFQTGADTFDNYDSSDLVSSRADVLGIKLKIDLDNGWSVANNTRYSHNQQIFNTTSRPYPQPLDDITLYALLGTVGRPGTYTLTDRATGASSIVQSTGVAFTVVDDQLPGSELLPGYGMNQAANVLRMGVKEWMSELTVTKDIGVMSFTAGAFYDRAESRRSDKIIGFGISTLTPQPRMLDVTLTTPSGQVLQVTNEAGFAAPSPFAIANVANEIDSDYLAFFFGHRWDFLDGWTLDWGVRRERVSGDAVNQTSSPGATFVSTAATGGVDGDANTLYDNAYVIPGPTVEASRSQSNTAYSGALNYELNSHNSLYLRYSLGKQVDLGFVATLGNAATNDLLPWIPTTTEQTELGYKLLKSNFSAAVTLYDGLQKSPASVLLRDASGNFYVANTPENEDRTRGIEAEGDYRFASGFALRAAASWQQTKAVHNWNLSQTAPGPVEDALLTDLARFSYAGYAMFAITPSYSRGSFFAQAQWRYLGDRWANANRAFELPAFAVTDLNVQWSISKALNIGLTVNNVFNDEGVMNWGPPGNVITAANPAALTREQVQANPDAVFIMLPVQARAYFLKATYEF